MEIVVCVERRGKTMPSRATPLQCMEHKSEINRMFIEQLFQWWQLVPARPRGIVFNRGTERERESKQNVAWPPFYNETRHLQDVQAITAERT